MRITKLDVLIVLIILVWLYFSFTGLKYFEIKGQDLFGAIMTYDTLTGRGFGVQADITGTGFDAQRPVKISGMVLDATGEKMYLWDGDILWVIFQKERFLKLQKEPQTPYLFPSSITLYPSESFRLARVECSQDSFSNEVVYITLDKPASDVLCSYVSKRIWDAYRGEVECTHGGSQIELKLTLLKGFDPASLNQLVSEFGYKIENEWSPGRECLVIEYD
jgi:hypothetical protein